MILLSADSLRKHFGPEPVLDGVSFVVRPGERIALVGPNGAGKTTLLEILAGRQDADSGRVVRHDSVSVGYLRQKADFAPGHSVWDEARTAVADLLDLLRESEETAKAVSHADDPRERDRLAERFERLEHECRTRGAYRIDDQLRRVLEGLGFAPSEFDQPVDQLSGGQQSRLRLAQVLLSRPDLFLLDEPSNHLDLAATEWLENYLAECSAAMILVSHDRYLLDRVATRTLELYAGTVDSYRGNFSAYWRQKEERLLVEQRTYDRQRAEIARLETFIRRNRYGQKHAQAEDRQKKLDRIVPVAEPRRIAAGPMGFPQPERAGDIVLRVDDLTKSYARTLFAGLSFEIVRGERWGIIGPNGTGKTTLLRCLIGQEAPDRGTVHVGSGVEIAYFDQRLAGLADDRPVVEGIRPPSRDMNEQQRRDLLARFGITGNMVFQSAAKLSGGERSRAALAKLAATGANLLILDEPTNHLDLWARDALELSMRRFSGTLLLVSHDRYFLNRVVDHLLVMERGSVRIVLGNYDAYLRTRLATASAADQPGANDGAAADKGAAQRPTGEGPRRRRRFPYRKTADLEDDIAHREKQIESLHASLCDPDVLRDGERVRALKADLEYAEGALAQLYEHWEEAAELN